MCLDQSKVDKNLNCFVENMKVMWREKEPKSFAKTINAKVDMSP